jgi:hypothetical protein
VAVAAGDDVTWTLEKWSNATALVLKPGQYKTVAYRVTATRSAPKSAYTVSGSLLVFQPPGAAGPVQSATVTLSGGASSPAACAAPAADGSSECRFGPIPYAGAPGGAAPGSAAADVVLADGRRLAAPPQALDFAAASQGAAGPGLGADLTDSFDPVGLAAATASGVRLDWDKVGWSGLVTP